MLSYAQALSQAGAGQFRTLLTWTAATAILVPLIATSAVPARFATAVLGGWLGGNVAAFVYFALLCKFEKDQGYQLSSATVVAVGLTLAALVVAVAIFARAAARREMTDATAS
jgi:tetrahydromethanopterin S-methyltransferase subunit D